MAAKNEVKAALSGFILRVAKGGAASEAEIGILPQMACVYFEHFGGRKGADAGEWMEDSRPSAQIVQMPDRFPLEGRVTVSQVAEFLRIKPGTVWKWLRDNKIPRPVVQRARHTRWLAEEIRASARKESESA
jgi:predicted DNA-binding transcriptional regulator AlpA